MKNQTCCFTGHINIPAHKYEAIRKRLEEEIINLINQAGGALGFDTLAALTVLKLKEEFPHISLILVLPCCDQAKRWGEEDKKIYDQILGQADKVVYTAEGYYNGCMHVRNRHLVKHSKFCICYLIEAYGGGTSYTVNYARQKGLTIINVALS